MKVMALNSNQRSPRTLRERWRETPGIGDCCRFNEKAPQAIPGVVGAQGLVPPTSELKMPVDSLEETTWDGTLAPIG